MKQLLLLLIIFLNLQAEQTLVYNENLVLRSYISKYKNESRTALIIGNENYKVFKKLRTPINDSKDMSSALKKLGFDIIYATNSNKKQMKELIRQFYEKLKDKPDGIGLFYYAGHGVEVDGKNYLIPVEADIKQIEDIETEGFSLADVTERMNNAKNRANIIILDASRENPFTMGSKDGLTTVKNADKIYIAFAAAPNQVAIENPKYKNSLFTKHILDLFNTKGLKIDDLFNEVRKRVYKESDGKQLPFVTTGLIGTFYFAIPENITPLDSDKVLDFNTLGEPIKKTESGTIIPYVTPNINRIKQYTLKVSTIPENCNIQFINKNLKYQYNMRLDEGSYEILISKDGYISRKGDIPLYEDVTITVPLSKKSAQPIKESIIEPKKEENKVDTTPAPAVVNNKKNEPKKDEKAAEFKVESKLIYVDEKNKLMWEIKTAKNKDDEYNWEEAKKYCENLSLGVFKDWRLPSKDELLKILADKKINKQYIINELSKDIGEWGWYWSSTSKDNDEAYLVYFSDKNSNSYDKEGKYYVRCVRNK